MPKDIPFYKLSKRIKIRNLKNTENVELNSTDSSMEFDEHISQSHASLLTVKSNSSEIPDFLPLQEEFRISNNFEPSHHSHHSELSQSSELIHHSENFDNFECSEHYTVTMY